MRDGESRSPPKVVMVFGLRARSACSSVMNGAKPPAPFFGCDLVDVVAMQDGDRDLVRQRLAAVQRQRQHAEPGGGKNFAT